MKRRGFTLIEMVVTVAIVAILATGALPLTQIVMQREKERDLRTALRQIREAIDSYKRASDEGRVAHAADASGYPPDLDALVNGVNDAKMPVKKPIYFLRRVPRDPFAADNLEAAQTWGRRSYESPPDDPREGKDVFDVYSMSEGSGLNLMAPRRRAPIRAATRWRPVGGAGLDGALPGGSRIVVGPPTRTAVTIAAALYQGAGHEQHHQPHRGSSGRAGREGARHAARCGGGEAWELNRNFG